jgi:hypothetical protein
MLAFKCFYCLLIYLLWDWGLNSGLYTFKAGVLPFELQPPIHFALAILEMESYELFARAGIKLQSCQSQLSK